MADGGFHGLERTVRVFGGARAVRVVHPPGQAIGEHRHDWPFLMLPALGGYVDCHDGGETAVAGPAAVLHPAGGWHANRIGETGLETLSVTFDPRWLARTGLTAPDRPHHWRGGVVAAAARALAAVWRDPARTEDGAAAATAGFLRLALAQAEPFRPRWLELAQDCLGAERPPSVAELARRLDLHPAYLSRAYRAATGEGPRETVQRLRVERALRLLRETDTALADVALAAGFCDQSHMNRAFRKFAGRSPAKARAERDALAGLRPTVDGH